MHLADYPDKIHSLEVSIISTSSDLAEVSAHIQAIENAIDLQVASDPSLKNEMQRKAARWLQLHEDKDYLDLTSHESRLSIERQNLIADLNHAKNSFTVAKLDRQLEIALHPNHADLGCQSWLAKIDKQLAQ
jgi:hypothetical protein